MLAAVVFGVVAGSAMYGTCLLYTSKENFKRFYNKYDIYIVPVAKFIAALVSFLMLNASRCV